MNGEYLYCFQLPDLHAKPEEIREFADNLFLEWWKENCDENNYFYHLQITLKDNRVIPFENFERPDNADTSVDWDKARRYALECIAADMRLWGMSEINIPAPKGSALDLADKAAIKKMGDLSYQELHQALMTEPLKEIIEQFQKLQADPGISNPKEWSIEDHRRRNLVKAYEALRRCPRIRGFTEQLWHLSPSDYRAFDLCDLQGTKEPNAILIVDIHT